MDATGYNDGLAELRSLRDQIRPLERELKKLLAARDKKISALGAYEKAKADRLATSAGLSVIDVVTLVPRLGPQAPTSTPPAGETSPEVTADLSGPQTAAQAITVPAAAPGGNAPAQSGSSPAPRQEVAEPGPASDPSASAQSAPVPVSAPAAPVAPPSGDTAERELPSIPVGAEGDRWFRAEKDLVSTRPNFTQAVRQMAFLDTATGVLVWQGGTTRLDLGRASVAEILTAVYATVPASIERIYITGGDPWHQNQARHEFLRDAVAAWLNGPLPEGWQVESSRGKDRQAGHLVHPRNPVGRWQRGEQHTEIRSVGEWFDPDGADPEVVRQAFVVLWKALREEWSDVVLMGSPSQTGRDLWTRTIPERAGAKWADGYPVMSQEIRGLLHATAGQGRTELIVPPRAPERVPGWFELDRTFAYARHCWSSGVGVPERMTAASFAALSEKEQSNALFSPSHWQVRVTIPEGWEHVGLLPAAAPGERSWYYPYEPGRTFTTWAGGPEISLALRNPVAPWRIEVLDGLVWEKGDPLKGWATKLREAWNYLQGWSGAHADERMRLAYRLASRAVRSILLYGIGTFAQRPKITTGSVELGGDGSTPEIPDGAQITGITDTHVTWQRHAGFARDQYAHPEWSAGVWSAARAALLSTHQSVVTGRDEKTGKVKVGKGVAAGALHLPPGSVLAFRTDAIYTTVRPDWPYSGQPGDYLLKGALAWEQNTPTSDDEFYALQSLGRQALEAEGL
ncbi:Mucin-19 [Streptomyces sasae]|uniref:Mucin-19 n=1 Tax=Streptomyces sasae TaxID=1266772 RepID=UPI00292D1B8D|nr:Mucin-19 [Streptomyces sasae]